jgi:sterol desaturase/sphingolipid hydroxylase (fatty acid hydroxylase superfamily)
MLERWLVTLAVDGGRYLLAAGAAFFVFWVWGRDRFRKRLVQGHFPRVEKMLHDVKWSACTVLLFSVVGVGVYFGGHAGVFHRYKGPLDHGWVWLVLSVPVLVVLQDTYFYWTHRAMHHPLLYRWFHRTHHVSTNPSPWTAYAFSPLEALVHAAFVPLVWLWLPLHEIAVFVFLAFMITRNVLGHLSMELFPSGFTKHRLFGWLTTTTHHALHHQHFRSNYGLYFTFWDRWMGTTDERYEATFEAIAKR